MPHFPLSHLRHPLSFTILRRSLSCSALRNTLLNTIVFTLSLLLVSCANTQTADTWSDRELAIIRSADPLLKVYTIADTTDSLLLRGTSENLSRKMLESPQYEQLAEAMVATVTSPEQDGVGIAGPQVGILRRVVAVQRLDKEGEPFEVYPNIRITEMRGELQPGPEGCLSVPGRRGEVMRSRDITIAYTSPFTLADTTEVIQGFTAVIFQHETDHLDGTLYIDKLQ